jgi:hypothetical protein
MNDRFGSITAMSAVGPECVKTRNFLDSGGASPLPYTEIVVYRRSSEAKFLDQNFIRSFHTASVGSGHVCIRPKADVVDVSTKSGIDPVF